MHPSKLLKLAVVLYGACVLVSAQIPKPPAAKPRGGTQKPATPKTTPTVEADREHLSRRVRFGHRELNLPLTLQNEELDLTNDELSNKLAQLEGRELESARITIDGYLVEQSKAAIQVSNWFAQVWSKDGDKQLQRQLAQDEAQFDEANNACHSLSDGAEVRFERIEDAEAACARFRELYVSVSQYHINTASVPSIFKEDAARATRTGYKFLLADNLQLKTDTAGRFQADTKQLLIWADHRLIDHDKMIWLEEIIYEDTVQFNAKHPKDRIAWTDGIVEILLQGRQDLAAQLAQERRKLLGVPTKSR